ncbi:hypothetical protein NIES267_23090 [Calothrix parasitica NIES-267]|uniref:Uncharacterized protein n=1 Tax=Calothrix parasitica NIES-267 TaxID=1973488 RepID=A0A1Z4LNJ3_9CYAN|nr:hypothetical protein NIES267_23090 [Calothrix parasitica NIES-267]
MGIPKKGSRKITVDSENFIWLIRRKETYSQACFGMGLNIAVEHAEESGSKLVILTDKINKLQSVTPIEVSSWINQAIKAGWEPKKSGKPFEFIVSS